MLVISEMRPHSPSITTTSSSRIGSLSAICKPASRFDAVDLAAEASSNDANPADASNPVPYFHSAGLCMFQSSATAVSTHTAPITTLRRN